MLKLPPLATTSIGSFPRPRWLAKTTRGRVAFIVSPEHMQEACDDATILSLRHQAQLDLDLVTDGEQRREGFIFHIAGQWDGVDTKNLILKERYRNRIMNQMVPRIVGTMHALDLLLTGRTATAAEAAAMNLVKLLPAQGFAAAVHQAAADLAQLSAPRSMAVIKRQVYQSPFQSLGEAYALSNEEVAKCFGTEDTREAMRAFNERRTPHFTGRY